MAKERPILFSGQMVRAILEGRKTQTRRVLKKQPPAQSWLDEVSYPSFGASFWDPQAGEFIDFKNPYGKPGDRLWVRETFMAWPTPTAISYRATSDQEAAKLFKWKPSIFMPRWASRITLEIVSVRVERVQEISGDDCRKEGIRFEELDPFSQIARNNQRISKFRELWDSINAKRGFGWDKNPWAWVVEFRRIENGV